MLAEPLWMEPTPNRPSGGKAGPSGALLHRDWARSGYVGCVWPCRSQHSIRLAHLQTWGWVKRGSMSVNLPVSSVVFFGG